MQFVILIIKISFTKLIEVFIKTAQPTNFENSLN